MIFISISFLEKKEYPISGIWVFLEDTILTSKESAKGHS